jgi:hypothetical protein
MANQPSRLRRTVGGSLAALAIGGIAATSVTPVASADPAGVQAITRSCPDDFLLGTPGGLARFTFKCAPNGPLTVSGWVQDTEADGKCAQVRVRFPGGDWKNSQPACPKGEFQTFSWSGPAPKATVDVFTYFV